MLILGIDPAWPHRLRPVWRRSAAIRPGCTLRRHHHPGGLPLSTPLYQISQDMAGAPPAVPADENGGGGALFLSKTSPPAFAVAHGRGVLLLEAELAFVPVFEYTPMQVKQAVAGYVRRGQASSHAHDPAL